MNSLSIQQAGHILRKDCLELRLQILILYILSFICWFSFSQGEIAREWSLTVNFGTLAAIGFLIFSATRSDSVVDSSAWWATRPIAPSSLFLAKLLLWFVAIALPFCICTAALSMKFHLNASQTLLAILEMILVTATASGFVATISSISPNARAIGLVGIPFAFLLFLGTMFSFQARSTHNRLSQVPIPFPEKSLTIGLCLLCLLAVGNWAHKVIKRGRGGSAFVLFTGLLVFIGTAVAARQGLNPKFKLSDSDQKRIQMTVLDEPKIFERDRQPSQLYGHFAFAGLADDEFVALDWINGEFRNETGSIGTVMHYGSAPGTRAHQFDHDILSQMQPLLLKHFPDNTSWSSEWNTRRSRMIPIGYREEDESITSSSQGHFEGELQAHILKLTPLETIPLQMGVYPLDSGRSLDVHAVLPQWNSIRVELALNRPLLALSKDPENNLITPYAEEETRYVLVIYHPSSNEAYLLENKHPSRRNPYRTLVPLTQQALAFNVPFSSLQSAINGLSMSDWLAEAEIRPFKINPVGTHSYPFSKRDYRPYLDSHTSQPTDTREKQAKILEMTKLPEDPSERAATAYIKAIIDQIPDRYNREHTKSVQKKIAALDPKFLPILLRLLPNDEGLVNNYIRPVITKKIRPEHLPAFKELWSRSDLLITEVRRQRWQEQVKDTMKARIKERRYASPTVIALAASTQDPAIYEDLAWHFVNSRWGHETMLREMKRCEGLNLSSLIEQAWRRAQVKLISVNGLALPAAAQGLPDGLRQAYLQILRYDGDARVEKRNELKALTDYEGSDDAFEQWLESHLQELHFDASSKIYRLEPRSPEL